jgi:hypothetical protein
VRRSPKTWVESLFLLTLSSQLRKGSQSTIFEGRSSSGAAVALKVMSSSHYRASEAVSVSLGEIVGKLCPSITATGSLSLPTATTFPPHLLPDAKSM